MVGSGSEGRVAPTLEEVAARAGVSRATASRVLRGATNVSDSARTSVLSAAEAVSYTPNRAARALVTGRSDSIAFMVAESEDRFFADPFFLGVLRGAQAVVAEADLQLVFTIVSEPEDSERFLRYAASGHIDGVLLLSLHGEDRVQQRLEAQGIPTVLSGRPIGGSGADLFYVDADNLTGGALAVQYLRERGRSTIATITGPLDMCASQDRLAGYRRAVGTEPDNSLVAVADFSLAGGHAAMTTLLARRPDLDAVFAASDMMAIGAIRALAEHGRKVPDDVAVIGFDDAAEAAVAQPPLTTVRQPITAMGRAMAGVLMERIAGAPADPATVFPVELIRRTSA